jgi:hypothetical protein
MTDIQKQCWDNYHATWAKQDEQAQDKIFIELIKQLSGCCNEVET